jgi:hypothetical protein
VEFTVVELAGGTELATPVEKATAGLCVGEACGERGGTVEREEDGLPCFGTEEMPAG